MVSHIGTRVKIEYDKFANKNYWEMLATKFLDWLLFLSLSSRFERRGGGGCYSSNSKEMAGQESNWVFITAEDKLFMHASTPLK